jgi:hypothetical protein
MRLLRRHKSVLIALGIYWPVIFWLTHVPIFAIARQSGMSDKTMHLMAYFVLTFLVWFAISPYEKVRWIGRKVWIVLAILVGYAAGDEVLQGYVGRSMEVGDFVADAAGILLALGLLTVLSFWSAMLTASAVFVFVISNKSNLLGLYPQYGLETIFHYTAYTAFTLIWIQHMDRYTAIRPAGARWLVCVLAVPMGLLGVIKGTAPLFDRPVGWIAVATAGFGIASAILISYLIILLARRRRNV